MIAGHAAEMRQNVWTMQLWTGSVLTEKEMESDWTVRSLTRVHLLYLHVAVCQGEDRGQGE